MGENRTKRPVKAILAIIGALGSIASIVALWPPSVGSQSPQKNEVHNQIDGNVNGGAGGHIILGPTTIIQQPTPRHTDEGHTSNVSLGKISKFYLESDRISQAILPSIEEQLMDYGIRKTTAQHRDHSTVVLRLRSKIQDQKYINGEYITRVGTKLEIRNSNTDEVIFNTDMEANGSSLDDYASSVRNASSLLKARIKNEGIMYEAIDSVKEKYSLK